MAMAIVHLENPISGNMPGTSLSASFPSSSQYFAISLEYEFSRTNTWPSLVLALSSGSEPVLMQHWVVIK